MTFPCSGCREVYDADYLRHCAIMETDVPYNVAVHWNGHLGGPQSPIRRAFRAAGWEFAGDSVYGVLRCSSCPPPSGGGPLFRAAPQGQGGHLGAVDADGPDTPSLGDF